MDELENLLNEEIKTEIRSISGLQSGSTERSIAIDDLVKLYKLRIETTKNDWDFIEKKEQSQEQIKDRYFRLGMEAAGIVLPLLFYAVWMRKGFKFEETGTYTSATFRGLFSRFKPTKR